MIVFAREVFLCKCSTDVPELTDDSRDDAALVRDLRFVSGDERTFARLDPAHHNDEHLADFRARLARGERWVVGLLGERIATYTWLHTRARCDYPYLPGCSFALPAGFGYGYDAWTPPDLRGGGLRRHAFVHELRLLRSVGCDWEASFFVAHQLQGATRSLASAGVHVVPLWRIALGRDRRLVYERLAEHAGVRPIEPPQTQAPPVTPRSG